MINLIYAALDKTQESDNYMLQVDILKCTFIAPWNKQNQLIQYRGRLSGASVRHDILNALFPFEKS